MGGRLVSFDIGNGLKWAKVASGAWMEMPAELHHDAVTTDDVPVHDGLRVLTLAEIERAERGLGPERWASLSEYAIEGTVEKIGGGAVFSPPPVPAGLTPEQATRYHDATATTLRQLISEASTALASAYVRFSAFLDESPAPYRGLHDELAYAHASYVVYGHRRWEPDGHAPMMGSVAIKIAIAALRGAP